MLFKKVWLEEQKQRKMCCGFGCCFRYSTVLVVVLALLFGGLNVRLKNKEFIFDKDTLSDLAKNALERTKGKVE